MKKFATVSATVGSLVGSGRFYVSKIVLNKAGTAITEFSMYDAGVEFSYKATDMCDDSMFKTGAAGWTVGAGWTKNTTAGTMTHTAASGTNTVVRNMGETSGDIYRVEMAWTATAGTITVALGGATAISASTSTSGTVKGTVIATGTGDFTITPSDASDAIITELHVYRIGTAAANKILGLTFTAATTDSISHDFLSPLMFKKGMFAVLTGANSSADIFIE